MDQHTRALLAGLAHDLRTPLAAIGGYAELLRVGVHGALLPKQQESLERIRINHIRMAELITDMVEYAEAVSGAERLFVDQLNIRASVTAVVEALAARALQRDATVIWRTDDGIGGAADPETPSEMTMVLADRIALDGALRGVLRDAIDASSGRTVRIRLTTTRDRVVIAFEGDAFPLDAAGCDALFRPFDHDARDQRPNIGSALILPRARMLARAFGGEVVAVPDDVRRILQIHVAMTRDASHATVETAARESR